MSSNAPSRAASLADRRASASVRSKTSRPASAALSPTELKENGGQPDARSNLKRKTATTVTTETTRNTQETLIRRTTRSPLKPTETNANVRASREEDRPIRKTEPLASKKSPPETAPSSWSPQATLLPPTSAPLASRISVPPLSSHAPVALRPRPLGSLSLQEQEQAIINDLLFVFMGFEGQYARYAESYAPLDEKSRLSGPQFRVEPGLDPSLRDLAISMLKAATH